VKRFFAFVLCVIFSASCFCADPITVTIEPYTKDECPTGARHVRRTEIITFGSLPFVTLGTTLGYSLFRYFSHDMNSAYMPNPLAKTSDEANLTQDEQMTVLAISAGISLFLGLTDLTINLIKQHNKDKKQNAQAGSAIIVTESSAISESAIVSENIDEITTEE
jgi:hypothetical protein